MDPKPAVLNRADWAKTEEHWHGRFEGRDIGTNVSVIFFTSDRIGDGPPLHIHPYDEVFILRSGRARFTIDNTTREATAGQILFAPANTPHKFENLGPDKLETTDIHLHDHIVQTNLEENPPRTSKSSNAD